MSETNANSNSSSNKSVWYKSPWVIGWLLLVLTVMAVNAFMIIQSINDFPGLVVDDFYERGQDYEENIHKKLADNNRWTPEFKLGEVHLNRPSMVTFSMTDSDGLKATAEKVTLFAYRPSNSKKDFSVVMTSAGNGVYQAMMTFYTKGNWDLLASVHIDGTEVNYAQDIFVKD